MRWLRCSIHRKACYIVPRLGGSGRIDFLFVIIGLGLVPLPTLFGVDNMEILFFSLLVQAGAFVDTGGPTQVMRVITPSAESGT